MIIINSQYNNITLWKDYSVCIRSLFTFTSPFQTWKTWHCWLHLLVKVGALLDIGYFYSHVFEGFVLPVLQYPRYPSWDAFLLALMMIHKTLCWIFIYLSVQLDRMNTGNIVRDCWSSCCTSLYKFVFKPRQLRSHSEGGKKGFIDLSDLRRIAPATAKIDLRRW